MTKNMLTFRKTIWPSGQDRDSQEHTRRDTDPGKAHEQDAEIGASSGSASGGLPVPRMTFADSATGSSPSRSSSMLSYPRRPEA